MLDQLEVQVASTPAVMVDGDPDRLARAIGNVIDNAAKAGGPVRIALAEDDDPLLDLMGFTPMTIDELTIRASSEASAIGARISMLEIAGRVAALPGGYFQQLPRE